MTVSNSWRGFYKNIWNLQSILQIHFIAEKYKSAASWFNNKHSITFLKKRLDNAWCMNPFILYSSDNEIYEADTNYSMCKIMKNPLKRPVNSMAVSITPTRNAVWKSPLS